MTALSSDQNRLKHTIEGRGNLHKPWPGAALQSESEQLRLQFIRKFEVLLNVLLNIQHLL